MMPIKRIKPKTHYTVIPNIGLEDPNLSAKAKGLLAYMLSKSDNWEFHLKELQNHFTDGRDSLNGGVKELIKAGYVQKRQSRNDNGKFKDYEWVVYDLPQTDLPLTDKPLTENPQLPSTDINQVLNKPNIMSDKSDDTPYKEIVEYLNDKTGKHYKYDKLSTRKYVHARWVEGFTVDDFKQVVDNKVADWKDDPTWDEYLRPSTLFNSTKFESYLNKNNNAKQLEQKKTKAELEAEYKAKQEEFYKN